MKEVPLTKGYIALVDDKDYARVSQHKWCALVSKMHARVYAVRGIQVEGKSKLVLMHRFILNLPLGHKPDVDHEDHNGLNNCVLNLRVCTRSKNNANQRKTRGTSKYKGVYWDKSAKLWHAQIKVNGHRTNLGLFSNEDDAGMAYDKAAQMAFGEFSNTNFGGSQV